MEIGCDAKQAVCGQKKRIDIGKRWTQGREHNVRVAIPRDENVPMINVTFSSRCTPSAFPRDSSLVISRETRIHACTAERSLSHDTPRATGIVWLLSNRNRCFRVQNLSNSHCLALDDVSWHSRGTSCVCRDVLYLVSLINIPNLLLFQCLLSFSIDRFSWEFLPFCSYARNSSLHYS